MKFKIVDTDGIFFLLRVPKDFDHPLNTEFEEKIQYVPKGDYYQVWESISNSPITKPYANLDDLIDHLISIQKDLGRNYTRKGWRETLGEHYFTQTYGASGRKKLSPTIVDTLKESYEELKQEKVTVVIDYLTEIQWVHKDSEVLFYSHKDFPPKITKRAGNIDSLKQFVLLIEEYLNENYLLLQPKIQIPNVIKTEKGIIFRTVNFVIEQQDSVKSVNKLKKDVQYVLTNFEVTSNEINSAINLLELYRDKKKGKKKDSILGQKMLLNYINQDLENLKFTVREIDEIISYLRGIRDEKRRLEQMIES
jgi:hypothetical protein